MGAFREFPKRVDMVGRSTLNAKQSVAQAAVVCAFLIAQLFAVAHASDFTDHADREDGVCHHCSLNERDDDASSPDTIETPTPDVSIATHHGVAIDRVSTKAARSADPRAPPRISHQR